MATFNDLANGELQWSHKSVLPHIIARHDTPSGLLDRRLVTVKQRGTGFQPVMAALTLRKGHDDAWLATNVPLSGTGTISFDIQAQITNNYVITHSVSYTHSSTTPHSQHSNLPFIHHSTSASHDPFGRRISATEDGVTRYFVHDGLDCIAELSPVSSFEFQVSKHYVRGSGLGGGIGDIIAEVSPTTTNYFCYNHRGDVVTLTRPDGQVTNRFEYTAFGAPVSSFQFQGSSGIRAIAFSSKEYDRKSGLSYYGFRYYDADSGRWLNKDPILWQGCMNLYSFSAEGPIDNRDLYGLFAFDDDTCCSLSASEKERLKKAAWVYVTQTRQNLRTHFNRAGAYLTAYTCLGELWQTLTVRCKTNPNSEVLGQPIGRSTISCSVVDGYSTFGYCVAHECGHLCFGHLWRWLPDPGPGKGTLYPKEWRSFPGGKTDTYDDPFVFGEELTLYMLQR